MNEFMKRPTPPENTAQAGNVQRKQAPVTLHGNAPMAAQIAQLQKNYGNQAVMRMLRSQVAGQPRAAMQAHMPAEPPVQAKWLDEGKETYRWDALVDGVRWYIDQEGLMYYLIESPDAIRVGKLKDYQQMEGMKKERAFWLHNSAVDFDILGGLDSSVVTPEHANDGVLDTAHLSRFKASQFKDLFEVGDGQILSVSKKEEHTGDLLKEVMFLNKIAEAGLRSPNPQIVEAIHKGKKTQGILMDKIRGNFVDFHKIPNVGVLGKALRMIAGGQAIDSKMFTEFGMVKLMQAKEPVMDEEIRQQIASDLEQILALQEELFINDLQAVIGPDGKITIIDPIWVGSKAGYVGMERETIIDTYNRLRQLIDEELNQQKKVKKKSPLDKVKSMGNGSDGFGKPPFGGNGMGGSSYSGPPLNTNSKFFT